MAGYFETFGNDFSSAIAGFAQGTSAGLISNLTLPISLCLTIYFVCKGYLIMAGRIQDSLTDLMLTCGKIALISLFALNAGNFINFVLPAILGLENFFVSAFDFVGNQQVSTSSAWAAIDNLWFTFADGIMEVWGLMSNFSITDITACLTIFAATLILAIGSVFFTFSAVGVLLINEICLTITLGFGPVFLCCLMFPTTRTWFDGWLKSAITYVFTIIIAAAVMLLFTNVFTASINDITAVASNEDTAERLSSLFMPLLNFTVLALTAAAMIRMVPSVAAGLTGGVAMQAVGVGQMMSGIGQGVTGMAGASLVGLGTSMGMAGLSAKGNSMLHGQSLTSGTNLGAATTGAAIGLGLQATAKTAQGLRFMGSEFWRGGDGTTTTPIWDREESHTDVGSNGMTQANTMNDQASATNLQKASAMANAIPEQYRADPNFSCPAQYQTWSPSQFENFAKENPSIQGDPNFIKAQDEALKAQWRQENLGPASPQIPEQYRADTSWSCPSEYANRTLRDLQNKEMGYDSLPPKDLTKAIEEAQKREWRIEHFGQIYE